MHSSQQLAIHNNYHYHYYYYTACKHR